MPATQANQQDAEIVLKLYDLRRETVMRESRKKMTMEFWPKSYDEAAAVMDMKHPLNTAFRQTSGYWEMAFGLAKHGAVHQELLVESSGEGLFLYGKFEPYMEELLAKNSPTMFSNTRWILQNSPAAAERMKLVRMRMQAMLGAK